MRVFGVTLLVFVVLLTICVGAGWMALPFQQASVDNVQKQWAFVYQYDESLQTTARNVCSGEKALSGAQGEDERSQRRTQVMAYEQNYQRLQAEYNSKLRNAFESKYVRPNDVPNRAPELADMKLRVCR